MCWWWPDPFSNRVVLGVRCVPVKNFILCLLLLTPDLVLADKPLWEAGFGVSALTMPAYRGSDQQTELFLPLPYFVYRGDNFRIDRSAVRNVWQATPRQEWDLSLGAAPPVKSHSVEARQGMKDLDPSFEVGVSWKYLLWEGEDQRLVWKWPVRYVFASNFKRVQSAGWVSAPLLSLEQGYSNEGDWRLGAQLGAQWATAKHHQYFYNVDASEASANRPEYHAHGGYSGAYLLFSATRRWKDWWVGSFVRVDDLNGAAYSGSPLVRENHNLWFGIGISRIFWTSTEMASAASSQD